MNQIYSATIYGLPPEMGRIRTGANQIAFWSWCAMLFCIPFSTALGLLFSAIAVVSALVGFSAQSLKSATRQPAIALCVALFAWLTVSMFWSIAPKAEMLEAWSKYRKLLYPLLVMMVLHNLGRGPSALVLSFLAGMGVVTLVSLASASGLLQLLLGPPQVQGGWYIGPGWLYIGGPGNPTFGRNHITQGAFLVFAATLTLGLVWNEINKIKPGKIKILILIIFALIALKVVSLLQGRTGYVLSLILFLLLLILPIWVKRARLVVWLWAILIPFFALSAVEDNVRARAVLAVSSTTDFIETNKVEDSGIRLKLWAMGFEALRGSELTGLGLGGYAEGVSRVNQDLASKWLSDSRPHPHSELTLVTVQGGAVGFILFVFLVGSILANAWKKRTLCPQALILTILYFSNSLFNSAIWDLAEGHLLALVIAMTNAKIYLKPPEECKNDY